MLNSRDSNALRIDYFRQRGILSAKIAKFPKRRNYLYYNKIHLLQKKETAIFPAIHIERFNRSI